MCSCSFPVQKTITNCCTMLFQRNHLCGQSARLCMMQEKTDRVARKWLSTEQRGNSLKYSSLAGLWTKTRRLTHGDPARPDPVTLSVRESGEGSDGKDITLLLLAGAPHCPCHGKSQAAPSEPDSHCFTWTPSVGLLFCDRCPHGVTPEPQVCFRCRLQCPSLEIRFSWRSYTSIREVCIIWGNLIGFSAAILIF